MLMAENARTGFVWNTFMKNPEAQRGMERAGFKKSELSVRGKRVASRVCTRLDILLLPITASPWLGERDR